MDRLFVMESAGEFKKENVESSERPIIGIAFDWRHNAETKENVYIRFIVDGYRRAIQNAGGELFIIDFKDRIEDVQDKIDGYIIPGGRDIHPRFYGEEINGALPSDQSEVHFEYHKTAYETLPKPCPILGICWGFQFLNVVNGGTMIQDLPDKHQHMRKRCMTVKQGSWLESVVGPNAFGNCYHHQALNRLAPNVTAVAFDDCSKLVHSIEVSDSGRFIVGVLWHPEITYKNESSSQYDTSSAAVLRGFVDKCRQYKNSKRESKGSLDPKI